LDRTQDDRCIFERIIFTIFHVFELLGALLGIAAGVAVGRRWFGVVGMIVGAVLGLFLGYLLGKIPYLIAVQTLTRNLHRCDVATLRLRLDKEYYISHLIIAELLLRGETIESFRGYVSGLLISDSPDRRRFGKEVLRIWPDTAQPPAEPDPVK
jgi:hypothetical protein